MIALYKILKSEGREYKGFFNKIYKFLGKNKWLRNSIYTLSAFFAFEGTELLFNKKVYAKCNIITKNDEEQSSFKRYEISPIVGVLTFDNIYNNSFIFGVRPLINITKKYAIEGEISFSPSNITTTKEDLKIFNYCCDFIYKYLLSKSIYSYGSVGIGGISFMPEDTDSNTDLYFNFGGGIKFLLKEKMDFRIDIRQYAPSVNLGLFSIRGGGNIFGPGSSAKTEVQRIIQLNLGITFLF